MNEDMLAYLTEIGLTNTAIDRIREIMAETLSLYPGNPEKIFVTDLIDASGVRRYVNLWILTDKGITEAKDFMTSKNIDFISKKLFPLYIETRYTDFYLTTANEKSRISVRINMGEFAGGFSGTTLMIFATKNNCRHLIDLIKYRFIPAALA